MAGVRADSEAGCQSRRDPAAGLRGRHSRPPGHCRRRRLGREEALRPGREDTGKRGHLKLRPRAPQTLGTARAGAPLLSLLRCSAPAVPAALPLARAGLPALAADGQSEAFKWGRRLLLHAGPHGDCRSESFPQLLLPAESSRLLSGAIAVRPGAISARP